MDITHSPHHHSHSAHDEVAPWVENMARAGYAAKAAIYMMIGGIAMNSAFSGGSASPDSQSAIGAFAEQPFGKVILVLLTIGLVCYALWRFIETFFAPREHDETWKHVAQRGGWIASGVAHAGLALLAGRMVLSGGSSSSSGEGSTKDMTATLMEQPFGSWLVVAVGLCIIGAAIGFFVQAFKEKYKSKFSLDDAAAHVRKWINLAAKAGISARGAVFLITGGFFIVAGLQGDSSEAMGMSGALNTLQAQPYGQILFAAVAIGLFAYGIYCVVQSRYGHLGTHSQSS